MTELFPTSSAVISPCGTYRYRLDRDLMRDGPTVAVFMVNPSTADHSTDDATIRKLLGFAERFGWGRIIVGNKFAYRATDVRELKQAADPIGPENNRHIEDIAWEADVIVVAWGSLAKLPMRLRERWWDVKAIVSRCGKPVKCLGVTKDGDPLHPVMIGYERELSDWPWREVPGEMT